MIAMVMMGMVASSSNDGSGGNDGSRLDQCTLQKQTFSFSALLHLQLHSYVANFCCSATTVTEFFHPPFIRCFTKGLYIDSILRDKLLVYNAVETVGRMSCL